MNTNPPITFTQGRLMVDDESYAQSFWVHGARWTRKNLILMVTDPFAPGTINYAHDGTHELRGKQA